MRNVFRRGRKIVTVFLVTLCVIFTYCMSTFSSVYAKTTANESIDVNASTSLTLRYKDGDTSINGARFSLYQIATVDANGIFTATDEFKDSSVKYQGLTTNEEWKKAADAFAKYIMDHNADKPDAPVASEDKINPMKTGTTAEGQLVFEGTTEQKMSTGLYLVVGEQTMVGSYRYTVAPFLMALPNMEVDQNGNNLLDYDVTVEIKYGKIDTSTPDPGSDPTPTPDPDPTPTPDPDPTTENVSVVKVWNDADNEDSRPERIHVNLYRDGSFIDGQELNAENNWRYTWTGLQSGGTWSVVETGVADPYTVTYGGSGTELTVENTYTETIDDNETPGGDRPGGGEDTDEENPDNPNIPGEDIPDNQTPGGSFDPGDGNGNGSGGGSGSNQTPTQTINDNEVPLSRLPQTGLLQWPIPILAIAGVVIFTFGWFDQNKRKREEHHEE